MSTCEEFLETVPSLVGFVDEEPEGRRASRERNGRKLSIAGVLSMGCLPYLRQRPTVWQGTASMWHRAGDRSRKCGCFRSLPGNTGFRIVVEVSPTRIAFYRAARSPVVGRRAVSSGGGGRSRCSRHQVHGPKNFQRLRTRWRTPHESSIVAIAAGHKRRRRIAKGSG